MEKSKLVGEMTLNDLRAISEEIAAQERQFKYGVCDRHIYFHNCGTASIHLYLNDPYNEKPHGYQEPVVSGCCVKEVQTFDFTETEESVRSWLAKQFSRLKTPAERERIHLAAKLSEEAGLAQHYSPELRKLWMEAWSRAMKDSGLLALTHEAGGA